MVRKFKKIVATVLTFAMVASLGAGFVPADNAKVAKAAVIGDEGSDGLTAVDGLTATSPDGRISVKIWDDGNGAYYYSAYLNDAVMIECSPFGLVTSEGDLTTGMTLDAASVKVVQGKDDYDLIQGPVNHVNKEWNQLEFVLTKDYSKVTMNFRVANDGVAFRYLVDADTDKDDEEVSVTNETSSFTFSDNSTLWTLGYSSTYEAGGIDKRSMNDVKNANAWYSTPVLAETDAGWALLSEASVFNKENPYCASVYSTTAGSKALKVQFGRDLVGEDDLSNHGKKMDRKHNDIKKLDFVGAFETPWRAIIMGEEINNIVGSSMISDLNPPAEGDFSWVKPGTSVWSWWSTGDPIEYESMFEYIDFCATAGITYCLVDFGWERWDNYREKVEGLVEYANEKNVGILLWYGVHKWDAEHTFDLDNTEDIEEEFGWCEEVGVKGVKVDYIESDSQFAMRNMYWILESAARHHLVVNFHGATDPNGENRTFPNMLSIEAVCGMEYFKWSDASAPKTLVTLPFMRNVIGSMEYTPALMSIPRSPATSGFMLSMCVNYESAVQTWAQSGFVYPGYNGFSLIADIPSVWDETIVLDGYPHSHAIEARRNGENWYVGAMTIEAARYDFNLDFLDEGAEYNAYIYKDNTDGSDIEVEKIIVRKGDVLTYDLLENGGLAMKLTKNDPVKWTEYDNYTFYEAEDAELAGNARIKDGEAYMSGKAIVEGLGSGEGNSITFNINVPEAGTYEFKPYIISANNGNLNVVVNGNEVFSYNDLIGVRGNGSAVGDGDFIDIDLEAGDNTIKVYTQSNAAPKLDRICVSKALITDATVALDTTSYKYTGSKNTPKVTVTRNGKTLEEGKEYEIFYSNAINPGTATVYVTGINGYGGQLKATYTIEAPPAPVTPQPTVTPGQPVVQQPTPAPVEVKAPAKVKLKSLKASKKKIKVTFKKVSGAKGYQISYATNKKFKKAKTLNVKAKAKTATIKKLKSGKKYFVRIRAYKKDGAKKKWGKWSNVKSVKVK